MFTRDFCLKTGSGFAATLTDPNLMQQGFFQCCKNISIWILFIFGFGILKQSQSLHFYKEKNSFVLSFCSLNRMIRKTLKKTMKPFLFNSLFKVNGDKRFSPFSQLKQQTGEADTHFLNTERNVEVWSGHSGLCLYKLLRFGLGKTTSSSWRKSHGFEKLGYFLSGSLSLTLSSTF